MANDAHTCRRCGFGYGASYHIWICLKRERPLSVAYLAHLGNYEARIENARLRREARLKVTCAYCGARPIANMDHVIPISVRKNRLRKIDTIVDHDGGQRLQERWATRTGIMLPEYLLETVGSCSPCNVTKMARLLVPATWENRLDELNSLGIGTFRVWLGDAESLREVIK